MDKAQAYALKKLNGKPLTEDIQRWLDTDQRNFIVIDLNVAQGGRTVESAERILKAQASLLAAALHRAKCGGTRPLFADQLKHKDGSVSEYEINQECNNNDTAARMLVQANILRPLPNMKNTLVEPQRALFTWQYDHLALVADKLEPPSKW